MSIVDDMSNAEGCVYLLSEHAKALIDAVSIAESESLNTPEMREGADRLARAFGLDSQDYA